MNNFVNDMAWKFRKPTKNAYIGLMRSIQFSISSYSQFSSGTQFVVCLIDMSVFMAHNNTFVSLLHVLWCSKY